MSELPPTRLELPGGGTADTLGVQPLLDEQSRCWGNGERALVEEYLTRRPGLPDGAVLELIDHEVALREGVGESPSLEEYLRRFPNLAGPLAAQFRLRQLGREARLARARGPLAELPGYEVLGELGRGGMGVVYKAREAALDRVVAVKVIRADRSAEPDYVARLLNEARAAARLAHPNVVRVHAVGEHEGQPFLALEYVEGPSLDRSLGAGPLPAREAAALAEALARGAHAAHERGIVHRDLKPANVLLAADGTPKVTDFGLAKRLDAETAATRSGAILGTPAYMAPEQAGGKAREVGPPADVWALGAILYECLTGRPPFQGDSPTDVMLRILADDPAPPRTLSPAVPRDLETIALKCLRKEPHKRYATAAELADDLRRYLNGEPIRARPLSPGERLWRRRRPLLGAGLALLMLALLGVGTHALLGWRRESRERAFDKAYERGLREIEREPKEAVASFTEALSLRRDPLGLAHRGQAYHKLKDYDSALADFAEVLRIDPDNAPAYRWRGWVFLALLRYDDAMASATEAIRLDSRDAAARRIRAFVYLNRQRWPDAAADLEAAVRLEPDNPQVYHLRSVLHAARGRWDEAVRDYARTNPDVAYRLFTEAAAALAARDETRYRQARDQLVTLAESTGHPVDCAQAARACALAEKTGIDPGRLRRLAEAGLKGRPGDSKALRVQALAWLRAGRAEDAVSRLDSLKAPPQDNPGINQLLLSIGRARLGQAEQAARALSLALKEGIPDYPVPDTLEYQILLREARTAGSRRE